MKALLVMRHAKSSWKNPAARRSRSPAEEARPPRGAADGRLLLEQKLVPDLVISSTALRAVETVRRGRKLAAIDGPVQALSELYLGAPETYVAALRRYGAALGRVLVIGHNPGLEELVDGLSGRRVELPTAAIVLIRLPIERWAGLALDARGTVVQLWTPKTLD